MYIHTYIYIYIYICRYIEREMYIRSENNSKEEISREEKKSASLESWVAAEERIRPISLLTFDSSGILIPRGGIVMSTGNFPDVLSRQILAGIILARPTCLLTLSLLTLLDANFPGNSLWT